MTPPPANIVAAPPHRTPSGSRVLLNNQGDGLESAEMGGPHDEGV